VINAKVRLAMLAGDPYPAWFERGTARCQSWERDVRSRFHRARQNAASLLRDLRRQQGRSLRSAAADIGIAPSQLSRLERGQRGLALEVSERLSDHYGLPSEIIALGELQKCPLLRPQRGLCSVDR
jgi:antitoxin component HigA of HigAB toxin-antitoxin module